MTELSELEHQGQVIELATMMGWSHMHVRKCRGRGGAWTTPTSVKGWPDWFFWHERRGESFLAELKTDIGKLSPDQTTCIASLREAGLTVHVWRPRDWDEIQRALTGVT